MRESIKKYVENPQLLIDLAAEIIKELVIINSDINLKDKKIQLIEINKAIKSLEAKNIQVPEGLRNEKIKLINEIDSISVTSKLVMLQKGFEELFKNMNGENGNVVPKKRVRSKEPKTDNFTLRNVLIEVLMQMGGSGKVQEIKVAMEKVLKDRFLPGDLRFRSDGKTLAWFNNVQWERLRMVRAGLLKKDSPNGYWELSGDGA